jgi:hypothetical protein
MWFFSHFQGNKTPSLDPPYHIKQFHIKIDRFGDWIRRQQ